MKSSSARRRTITAAQRGQIIQLVIVDRWTSTDAGAVLGVPERLVDAWVADYRRHGMASLRHTPSRTVAAEIVRLRFWWPAVTAFRAVSNGLRRLFVRGPAVQPLPLRRSNDERRGGGS